MSFFILQNQTAICQWHVGVKYDFFPKLFHCSRRTTLIQWNHQQMKCIFVGWYFDFTLKSEHHLQIERFFHVIKFGPHKLLCNRFMELSLEVISIQIEWNLAVGKNCSTSFMGIFLYCDFEGNAIDRKRSRGF